MLIGFRSLGLALEPFCCCGAMLGGLSDLNKLDFKAFLGWRTTVVYQQLQNYKIVALTTKSHRSTKKGLFGVIHVIESPWTPANKGRFLSPCCYSGLPAPPAPQNPWTTSSTASGMDKPPGVAEQRYNFSCYLRRKLPKSSMLIRLFWTILSHVEAYWTKKSHEGSGEEGLADNYWIGWISSWHSSPLRFGKVHMRRYGCYHTVLSAQFGGFWKRLYTPKPWIQHKTVSILDVLGVPPL